MSEVNIPLLRKAVEWAEAEAAKPRELCEWEQGVWALSAEERAAAPLADMDLTELPMYEKAPGCGTCYCIAGFVAVASGVETVGYYHEVEASRLLGLDPVQACDLFHADNTIEDVRRIAESLAGERL